MSQHKVLLIVPTLGWVKTELASRLEEYRQDPNVRVVYLSNIKDHAAARNAGIIYHFDPGVYTHVLFVDADTVPPAHFVERLLAVGDPIVSGMTYIFRPPVPNVGPARVLPALWLKVDQPDGTQTYAQVLSISDEDVVRDPRIATGCFTMLIASEVFERLAPPYFKTEYLEPTQEKVISEDLYFCRKAAEAGFTISILRDLVCHHHKTTEVSAILAYGREQCRRDALSVK